MGVLLGRPRGVCPRLSVRRSQRVILPSDSRSHRTTVAIPGARRLRLRAQGESGQAITHTDRLRASARARAAFSHDLRIARILRSPFLILETPPGLRFHAVQVAGLRELAGMSGDGLRLGLEPRAYRQRKLPEALRRTMGQDRVLDVVDLSQ